ncbi:MAG TPA: N-acetylglucosamine-6-phosphate deacetylase [Candidatus Acidoferrales bacterium]|jgi:N-acetylglucosamine-6-phosphate deacetylase|nr:N-acetylglucosamine-6-phosphate deacetylase [Candidatus Acidoferrales bacterium]
MSTWAVHAGRAFTPHQEIEDAVVVVEGGTITAVGTRKDVAVPEGARMVEAPDATLVPGFVDVHVHGAGGQDVMAGTAEALETVAETLARGGTTSFLATTVTAAPERLLASAQGIARHAKEQNGAPRSVSPRAEILGIHYEGPFISAARRGVHPAEWIAKPSPELFGRMLEAAGGMARILTLAPEVPGGLELVRDAVDSGLVASLGHTDATYEQAMAAIERGARHAAHVFNAMRPFSHRDTGVLGAVFTSPQVTAELIADGVHVDAAAMKLLLKAKTAGGVILVSDGTAATGMRDGRYRLGDFEVDVKGGVVRNTEGKLAGSALPLDRALRNILALGVPMMDAVWMLTVQPARLLGIEKRKGVLAEGADADMVLLDAQMQISGVIARGVGFD